MIFKTFNSKPILPPKNNILNMIDFDIQDKDILCITSKILAIHQGRCIKIGDISKDELIRQEASKILCSVPVKNKKVFLTIKDNIMIASAGIDESNSNGYYILWPENTQILLHEIHNFITKKYNIKNLGIISTDSHVAPLRRGIRGIAQSSYGFKPIKNYIGTQDIFGRKLEMTTVNIPDCIAATAVLMMGEGNEATPFCVARNVSEIEFGDFGFEDTCIDPKEDLYRDLMKL